MLITVTLLAALALTVASLLRGYADSRRDAADTLLQLETLALEQSRLLWQAIGESGSPAGVPQLRAAEGRGRNKVYEQLNAFLALEEEGRRVGRLLGLRPDEDLRQQLEFDVNRFLSGVQGMFGQLSIASTERVVRQMQTGDARFGWLQESLSEVRAQAENSAERAGRVAGAASALAALLTLAAAVVVSLRLSLVRRRRQLELEAERLATLAASEKRFKGLVQNASDLIMLFAPSGELRYVSPSVSHLLGVAPEALLGRRADSFLGRRLTDLLAEKRGELELAGRTFDLYLSDLCEDEAVGGVVLNARDVSERKALEARLRYQALHDPLTELPNRRRFQEAFEDLSVGFEDAGAVFFLDLDGFKLVNDSYSHAAGDRLLTEVALRLSSCLREGDVLARQGGDEFLVLSPCRPQEAKTLAASLLGVLEPPFELEGGEVFVSASLGLVTDLQALSADEAVQRADIAMYRAKSAGKARAVVFDEAMLVDAPERLALETDFRRGLERNEFRVYYQPKVDLDSGQTKSLEALVRWEHPEKGLVSPGVFIPFAEESGLIGPLGRIILEQACWDAARWQDQGIIIAVNLSPVQFRNPRLVEEVALVLEETGLRPEVLELEITESAVLGNLETTTLMLDGLKALGVRLAIDDFGTGYSNLSHLKHFSLDVLKIDQSFIRGGHPGTENLSDSAIVEAVIAMSKALGLHVVAEGVETSQHAAQLKALGCDLGQGYYFSKPVPAAEIDLRLSGALGVAEISPERP